MKSKLLSLICSATFAIPSLALATTLEDVKAQLKSSPYETSVKNNDAVFGVYCTGQVDSTEVPQPNYENALVKKAAGILTKTKVQADARLKARAEESFKNSLPDIQTELNNIISKSPSSELGKKAQIILDEINQTNVSGLSATAKTAYQDMGKALVAQLTPIVPALSLGLQKDLVGIDAKKLKAVGLELEKQFASEVKPVGYMTLDKAINALIKIVNSNVKPYDLKAIKKTTQELIVLIDQGFFPKDEATYIKETAEQVIRDIDTGTADSIQNMSYSIGNLNYYTSAEFLPDTSANEPAFKLNVVFNAESQKSNDLSLVTSLNDLLASVKAKDVNTLSYQALSTAESLETNLTEKPYLFGKTASEQKQSATWIASLKTEAVKFPAQNVITSIKKMNAFFAQGTEESNQEAINVATGDIDYSISQVASSFSEKTQNLANAFRAEVGKQNSSQYIANAQELEKQMTNAKGILTEALLNAIQSVGYNMENPLSVTPATQKLVDSFKQAYANVDSYSLVANYIDPILQMSESGHFYFYGGVRKMYGLSDKLPEAAKKARANKEAHWFLTQLCGEFRDRATMIEAKLKWVENLYTLEASETLVTDPETLAQAPNVWSRITAAAYYPYINFTSVMWDARKAAQDEFITVGSRSNVDNPVKGATVCETKYIFAKYIAEGKGFESVEEFNQGYESFKTACPKADLTDYYDFRGDSNFKHYSPESNGMIWYATTMASACRTMTESKTNGAYKNTDCENYFKRPFYYRYNAARAGLATWLFRDDQYADTFGTSGSMVAIYPHTQPDLAPFSFGFDQNTTEGAVFGYDKAWLSIPNAWNTPDIGFNAFTGMGTDNANMDSAYERIRASVDRHTDWYSSGYNDGNGTAKDQAYSPFVASSYEMSASNGFTSCGTTVQCPPDGLKRWMFIFRIKAQNWYTPERLANNEPVDFDRMWFDETSFGDSGLANSEKAWDRLGTAMEGELDSILYLINVDDDGGGGEMEGE